MSFRNFALGSTALACLVSLAISGYNPKQGVSFETSMQEGKKENKPKPTRISNAHLELVRERTAQHTTEQVKLLASSSDTVSQALQIYNDNRNNAFFDQNAFLAQCDFSVADIKKSFEVFALADELNEGNADEALQKKRMAFIDFYRDLGLLDAKSHLSHDIKDQFKSFILKPFAESLADHPKRILLSDKYDSLVALTLMSKEDALELLNGIEHKNLFKHLRFAFYNGLTIGGLSGEEFSRYAYQLKSDI